MEDLPDKVSKLTEGLSKDDPRREIFKAMDKLKEPEDIERVYKKRVVAKIKRDAKKGDNGTIKENPEKYACANIARCFKDLDALDDSKYPNKQEIKDRWFQVIPGLEKAYLNEDL